MRSDPTIVVTCDKCQDTQIWLSPPFDVEDLIAFGWKVDDGQDICPECQEEAPSDKG